MGANLSLTGYEGLDHIVVNGKRYGMVDGYPARTGVFEAYMAGHLSGLLSYRKF